MKVLTPLLKALQYNEAACSLENTVWSSEVSINKSVKLETDHSECEKRAQMAQQMFSAFYQVVLKTLLGRGTIEPTVASTRKAEELWAF